MRVAVFFVVTDFVLLFALSFLSAAGPRDAAAGAFDAVLFALIKFS